ncbi:hypothetical protein M758_11G060200 [Ceratodon purpureus]|nr:hypothetical protein M758_11G060200 [Ceratodon purpureus]
MLPSLPDSYKSSLWHGTGQKFSHCRCSTTNDQSIQASIRTICASSRPPHVPSGLPRHDLMHQAFPHPPSVLSMTRKPCTDTNKRSLGNQTANPKRRCNQINIRSPKLD